MKFVIGLLTGAVAGLVVQRIVESNAAGVPLDASFKNFFTPIRVLAPCLTAPGTMQTLTPITTNADRLKAAVEQAANIGPGHF